MSFNNTNFSKSIFPCRTSTTQGTAFYVGNNKLLTARHVVLDILYQNGGEWAYVEIYGNNIKCKAIEIGSPQFSKDIALLEIADNIVTLGLKALTLTESDHYNHRDLHVIGYPEEAFDGKSRVELKFKERIELTSPHNFYDDLITFSDDLDLSSYEGISGSPVLNGLGSVVGIATYQHNHMIGYIPIKNITLLLLNHGITPSGDAFRENNSPFGNYTAREKLEESKSKVSTRYKDELHQPIKGLTEIEQYFTNIDEEKECKELAKQIKSWVDSINNKDRKGHVAAFCNGIETCIKEGKHDDAVIDLCANSKIDVEKDLSDPSVKKEYASLQTKAKEIHKVLDLIYFRCVFVAANAGMGKTHGMCHLADSLIDDSNVYLMFGTDFSFGKTAKKTFLDNFNLTEQNLEDINSLHKDRSHKALIIIDALNEGAGNAYWREQMNSFVEFLKSYTHIKLLVTYRKNLESEFQCFNGEYWREWKLDGFQDRDKAIEDYCRKYEIDTKLLNEQTKELFIQPLFLSAFCEAYKGGAHFDSLNLDKLSLFKRYIKVRNIKVSDLCGEDPCRNVTQQMLSDIAGISVFQNSCDIVERGAARDCAEKISPNRLWKHHLLKACLDENLLLPITRQENLHFVMFEYEEMGDYLKADAFLSKVLNEQERWNEYIKLSNEVKQDSSSNKDKFNNFNKALFENWKLKEISEEIISEIQKLDGISAVLQEMQQSDCEPVKEAFKAITQVRPMSPTELISNVMTLSDDALKMQHKFLLDMELSERDIKWSSFINSHDDASIPQFYPTHPGSDIYATELHRLVWINIWILSASYPEVRLPIVRSLVSLFKEEYKLIRYSIDLFAEVNDPYVIKGLLCAVYGMLLTCRDLSIIEDVVGAIHDIYKKKGKHWADDIQSRQWLLHILEYGYEMLPDKCPYWKNVTFPISDIEDPFLRSKEIELAKGFFGQEVGSHRLYLSLCGMSDFNRYILGTNSHNELYHFLWSGGPKDKELVMINDVTKAMAYIIKNEYGWNEELGKYDATVPYTERFEQPQERIGKKYQWLSLHKVVAYLTDHCLIERDDNKVNKKYYQQSYPWFCRYSDSFDPAMPMDVRKTKILFKETQKSDTIFGSSKEWIDDDSILPELQLFREDAEGRKWINMGASLTNNVNHAGDSLNSFVFYNCFLVRDEDVEMFCKWAKEQSFGGRWMPEQTGQTEFLWNEYPWSSSFKDRLYPEEAGYIANDCPCTLYHASVEQLQENLYGIPDSDNYPSRACAPNVSIMESLSLYTAERGVVRRKSDDTIVAVNGFTSSIQDISLWMLDTELQQYLNQTSRTLAIIICGEKSVTQPGYKSLGVKDYTGCNLYKADGAIETIQKLKVEPINR